MAGAVESGDRTEVILNVLAGWSPDRSRSRHSDNDTTGSTMKRESITFEVTQDLLASLKLSSVALGQSIRLLAAIAYFKDKRLSLGKAAQLAGLNRIQFMDVLADQGVVVFDYDETVLSADLDGIRELGPSPGDHQ